MNIKLKRRGSNNVQVASLKAENGFSFSRGIGQEYAKRKEVFRKKRLNHIFYVVVRCGAYPV